MTPVVSGTLQKGVVSKVATNPVSSSVPIAGWRQSGCIALSKKETPEAFIVG